MRKKINVTRECILRGDREHGGSCPIALALIYSSFEDVFVFDDGIAEFKHEGGRRTIKLSPKQKIFITRFDSGKPVKPFSFWVRF